ncbi:hypothetical protein HPB52_004164 [Rhipicephalus sanguineus]|uniref:Tick transposon n=1 Tax=Rhipicephalus sanguineus TaxID=34632 RepID=A0A9D4PVE9_RHISA|nr:hypothetical protein HPB52_004164 [Rhipicephalus sanguineus]
MFDIVSQAATDVASTNATTQQALEVCQREAGRTALTVHGFTPNEAVEDDLGWSSFKMKEEVAKLAYERSLSSLTDSRWAWDTDEMGHPNLLAIGAGKSDIAEEVFYDNSRGSGLLCEARSGVFRMWTLRARFTAELDTTCPLCQDAEDTIRYIVLECTCLQAVVPGAQDSNT